MGMQVRIVVVVMGLAGLIDAGIALSQSSRSEPPRVRIVVEPDFLVSRDGEVPHVETMVAANPKNPRNLIGASIVGGRSAGGYHVKTYASHDGGLSWIDRSFPELVRYGGGDPQVAFTPSGAAVFTALGFVVDDRGRTRAALLAWRSLDGGLNWAGPSDLGVSYDHEMLAVDRTRGRFAGRLYLSALYGRNYTLGLFRSEDDGESWIGPVEITDGGDHGVNSTNLVVFSDGELLLTWVDFPVTPKQDSTWQGSHYWTTTSKDGGITFSPPRQGLALGPRFNRSNPDIRLYSDPGYAVDPTESQRDRVYLAFTLHSDDGPRVMFSRSNDRGATWSPPVPIDPSRPKGVKQFMPRIAVNRVGTLAVSFFDSRESKDGTGWYEYFTASIDGGNSFLAPVRVSTELSRPGAVANERLEPTVFSDPTGGIRMGLISGGSRWGNGGDYLGLTVDSTEVFHPFWADARTGTYQLWTARVRVERPPPPRRPSPIDALLPPEPPPPVLVRPTGAAVDVSRKIELVFDPTTYDPGPGELTLRVRLRNVSSDSLFTPLLVEVKDFGSGMGTEDRENAPVILNASNGKPGPGASFDFSAATGADPVLAPQGQTAAVVWRIRLRDVRRTPDFHLVVSGVLRR
jgi:hypothetical protein